MITSIERNKRMNNSKLVMKEAIAEALEELIKGKKKTPISNENTYNDSFREQREHQPNRDTIFMDRDLFVLHNDLQKIIKLLENKK